MKIKIFMKRLFLFLFFLVIIGGIGIGVYAYFNDENIVDIITKNEEVEKIEGYNGIYSYTEKLTRSYNVFQGCNVIALYNYVVVINDIYKYYDSSCMSTTFIKEGKTDELNMKYDKEKKSYVFEIDGKQFAKDDRVNEIVEKNDLTNRLSKVTLDTLKFIIERTEKESDYYNFDVDILGASKKFSFKFDYNETSKIFMISLIGESGTVLYTKTMDDLKNMPLFYEVNDKIAIIDNIDSSYKYQYNLLLYDSKKQIYNLSQNLPIKVNNISLNFNNQVYIEKTDTVNSFKVLFGYEKEFCNDSKTEGTSFYEFEVNYDYRKNNFTVPDFVKIGRYSDGCSYVKDNYFKEG